MFGSLQVFYYVEMNNKAECQYGSVWRTGPISGCAGSCLSAVIRAANYGCCRGFCSVGPARGPLGGWRWRPWLAGLVLQNINDPFDASSFLITWDATSFAADGRLALLLRHSGLIHATCFLFGIWIVTWEQKVSMNLEMCHSKELKQNVKTSHRFIHTQKVELLQQCRLIKSVWLKAVQREGCWSRGSDHCSLWWMEEGLNFLFLTPVRFEVIGQVLFEMLFSC